MKSNDFLKFKATENRISVLKTVMATKKGHIGGTYSCIDILTVLYYCIMRYNLSDINDSKRDRLIVGKGHACLGIYNILVDLGFIDKKYLEEYGSNGSYLGAQLDMKVPGVETNTGSLGHAVGIGAGLALASKMDHKGFKTYVLVGDGECDEGSIWESAMFVGQNQIENLFIIVDRNRQSVTDFMREEDEISSLEEKFGGCGIPTVTIDGHNFNQLKEALSKNYEGPVVIIADTVKGKGVSYMESGIKWHHSVPEQKQYEIALKELSEVLQNE
jgi:transketolase